jgi:hypothetical protein
MSRYKWLVSAFGEGTFPRPVEDNGFVNGVGLGGAMSVFGGLGLGLGFGWDAEGNIPLGGAWPASLGASTGLFNEKSVLPPLFEVAGAEAVEAAAPNDNAGVLGGNAGFEEGAENCSTVSVVRKI